MNIHTFKLSLVLRSVVIVLCQVFRDVSDILVDLASLVVFFLLE